mgnify:CR=1 FL=1
MESKAFAELVARELCGTSGVCCLGRGWTRDGIVTVVEEVMAGYIRAHGGRGPIEVKSAPELLRAARQAQCACSIKERDSGHLLDCWMPALTAAIAKAR